jgi:hypothetical protein
VCEQWNLTNHRDELALPHPLAASPAIEFMLNAVCLAPISKRTDRFPITRVLLAQKFGAEFANRGGWHGHPVLVVALAPGFADGCAGVVRVQLDRAIALKREMRLAADFCEVIHDAAPRPLARGVDPATGF